MSPGSVQRSTGTAVTPLLMGVLNASKDSLVGGVDLGAAAALAEDMVRAGAAVLDVGGQSLRTDSAEIGVEVELARVLPVLEAVTAACPDTVVSIDTYRAEVAAAALDAGARLVNDPSGLIDPAMAEVVAVAGAEVVLAYSRATPKVRMTRDRTVGDPLGDGIEFLGERLERLAAAGVPGGRVIVDIGPDLGKTPEQTIEVLRRAGEVRHALGGVRMLFAVSRKDFVGALVHRAPSDRDAGTFGALSAIDFAEGDLVRVHDVAAVADFFTVRAALLDGHPEPLDLPEAVRYDP